VARPNLSEEKRAKFLPVIAGRFAEQGYRRTTTAELAEACGVQETILYRLWPGKKRMFLAAIEYVYENSAHIWRQVVDRPSKGGSRTERLLEYESRHLGELGLYRIIFAGLSETDDPVGLGMVANLSRDVRLFGEKKRRSLIGEVGRLLLEGKIT
jgi:AcrR family transcriptional regulator